MLAHAPGRKLANIVQTFLIHQPTYPHHAHRLSMFNPGKRRAKNAPPSSNTTVGLLESGQRPWRRSIQTNRRATCRHGVGCAYDCGRFLDSRWAARAATLGWGPLDLFGCDRERPFVRVDHLGLLWLLYGGTIIELHRDRAIIERDSGARQTYRRRPVEIGRVALAWELSS